MKTILAIALAAGVAIAGTSAVEARDGCGGGFHRGPAGRCRPNGGGRGPVLVAPGIIVGGFYPGRGFGMAGVIITTVTGSTAAGVTAKVACGQPPPCKESAAASA